MSKTIQYLDLAGLKALYGVVDGKITTAVDGLKGDVSNDYNTLKKIEDKVKENANALEILNGTEDGSVNKKVADEIAKIVAGASEDFDTLKEIADYIASDKTGAADLNNKISANTNAITKLNGDDTVEGSVAKSVKDAVDGLKGDVSNDYNTLKKIEDKVVAEITRATNAENVNKDAIDAINNATNGILAQSKAYTDSEFTKRTTIASYGITDAVINETAPSIKLGSNELVFTALTTAEIQSAANPNTESES